MKDNVLEAKQAVVKEITDKISNASSTVVVEYRGLSVAEMTELRRTLRAEGVELKVYKNTMAERAVADMNLEALNDTLKGPNALVFGQDEVAPARILAKFAKTHDKLVIKSGVVDGKVVDQETVMKLSKLPNKEGMISMFLGCLQSPIIKFACAVKAVKEQKEENGESAPSVEAEPAAEAAENMNAEA